MVNKPQTKQDTISNYYPPTQGDLLSEFENTHPSYQKFRAKGLDKNKIGIKTDGTDETTINRILDNGLFRRVRRFLIDVDLAKGPIVRKVNLLERRRSLDITTNTMKEFLVVHVSWIAQDYLGNKLEWQDFREGLYNDPVIRTDIVNGKRVTHYVNWQPIYDIPFSVEAVNQALENQTNPPELVKYMVRPSQTHRDNTYSLEQFRDTTWEEVVEISRKGKGANR